MKEKIKRVKRIRKSKAMDYDRKHTCRHCSYKSFTIVHMHEQTCELNPNRDAYITKRYGPNHLTGDMICKLRRAALLKTEQCSVPLSSTNNNETLPLVTPSDLDSVFLSDTISCWCLLTINYHVPARLPELSQEDLDSVFGAL